MRPLCSLLPGCMWLRFRSCGRYRAFHHSGSARMPATAVVVLLPFYSNPARAICITHHGIGVNRFEPSLVFSACSQNPHEVVVFGILVLQQATPQLFARTSVPRAMNFVGLHILRLAQHLPPSCSKYSTECRKIVTSLVNGTVLAAVSL